ncbi:MAG: hypothetical protein ACTHN0_06245 [Aquihabitans sp.]
MSGDGPRNHLGLTDLEAPVLTPEEQRALDDLLSRIPDRWFAGLSVDPGWLPVIARLHLDLVAIDPTYEVHQVKEKIGGLRYHFAASADLPPSKERAMRRLVGQAAHECSHRCQACGRMAWCGESSGWFAVLCERCRRRSTRSWTDTIDETRVWEVVAERCAEDEVWSDAAPATALLDGHVGLLDRASGELAESVDQCDVEAAAGHLDAVRHAVADLQRVVPLLVRGTILSTGEAAVDVSGEVRDRLQIGIAEAEVEGERDDEVLADLLRRDLVSTRVSIASGEVMGRCRALADAAGRLSVDDAAGAGECLARCRSTLVELDQWYEAFTVCLHGFADVMGRYPGEAGDVVETAMDFVRTIDVARAWERFFDRGADDR